MWCGPTPASLCFFELCRGPLVSVGGMPHLTEHMAVESCAPRREVSVISARYKYEPHFPGEALSGYRRPAGMRGEGAGAAPRRRWSQCFPVCWSDELVDALRVGLMAVRSGGQAARGAQAGRVRGGQSCDDSGAA